MNIPEKYLKKISKQEIREYPLRKYSGPIYMINTFDHVRFAIENIMTEQILGFDTESKPSFKKGINNPPSVLQLATEESVFIFQLSESFFPSDLHKILSSAKIIKTGVAIKDDVIGLNRISQFDPAGFIDLGEISKKLGLQTHGLQNLAANLLGFRISKTMQRSNWGRKKLSKSQILYAATDAWVSREVHLQLKKLKLL